MATLVSSVRGRIRLSAVILLLLVAGLMLGGCSLVDLVDSSAF